jgi:hypothetical protein
MEIPDFQPRDEDLSPWTPDFHRDHHELSPDIPDFHCFDQKG